MGTARRQDLLADSEQADGRYGKAIPCRKTLAFKRKRERECDGERKKEHPLAVG